MKLNTSVAVSLVLDTKELTKYGLGKSLGMSATSVEQWLKGTRMSRKTADKFNELYDIEINDVYEAVRLPANTKPDGTSNP